VLCESLVEEQILHRVAANFRTGAAHEDDVLWVGIRLLQAPGVQLEQLNGADSRGMSALHYAAGASDPSFLKALLRAGASFRSRSRIGFTPLHVASVSPAAWRAVQVLLDAGADPNEADDRGWTCTKIAAHLRNKDATRLMLQKGGIQFIGRDERDLQQVEEYWLGVDSEYPVHLEGWADDPIDCPGLSDKEHFPSPNRRIPMRNTRRQRPVRAKSGTSRLSDEVFLSLAEEVEELDAL